MTTLAAWVLYVAYVVFGAGEPRGFFPEQCPDHAAPPCAQSKR